MKSLIVNDFLLNKESKANKKSAMYKLSQHF